MDKARVIEAINLLAKHCHDASRAKGFYDYPPTTLESHMLIVSEVAEASESFRSNQAGIFFEGDKPCGQYAELVDVLMRTLDYLAYHGVNVGDLVFKKLAYNETRPYMHGKRI